MKNWTIRQRLLASFFTVLAILLNAGINGYAHLSAMANHIIGAETNYIPALYYNPGIANNLMTTYVRTVELIDHDDNPAAQKLEADWQSSQQRLEESNRTYEAAISD